MDLASLLDEAEHGLLLNEVLRLMGLSADTLPLPVGTLLVGTGPDQFIIQSTHWIALRLRALNTLREFHELAPIEAGCDIGQLRRSAFADGAGCSLALWRLLIEELVGEATIISCGPWLRLPEETADPSDEVFGHHLVRLIASGGFQPPWVRDLSAMLREPETRVRQALNQATKRGTLYFIVPDLYYHPESIRKLAAEFLHLAKANGGVQAAQFRDATRLGRKPIVRILEFFDRVGFTHRVDHAHLLREDSGWFLRTRLPHATPNELDW